MYVTSLFAVLPKEVSMEAIREVETLPRKYKVESGDSGPGLSAQVKRTTPQVTVCTSCDMIQEGTCCQRTPTAQAFWGSGKNTWV